MKIPLRFQATEYDCGTVSITNAISYLFEREEVPPDLIKTINNYSLDNDGEDGKACRGGTSIEAVREIADYINDYAKENNFGIHCEVVFGEDEFKEIKNCLLSGGAVVARVWDEKVEHYITLTGIEKDEYLLAFDPYYVDSSKFSDSGVQIVKFRNLEYNRRITIDRFLSNTDKDMAMVSNKNRESLLIFRI